MKDILPLPVGNKAKLIAEITASYVSTHVVPKHELSALITEVLAALSEISAPKLAAPQAVEKLKPAVSVRKSLHDDHIVCLECGDNFKSMKRHLAVSHELTPDDYRSKWRLPADYPMVAPAYAEARSILAREMGLGRGRHSTRGRRST